MNRNALLLYLRDLRDLEFAKHKINSMYNQEKWRCEREQKPLLEIEYYDVPESESGLGSGTIGIIIVGIILDISSFIFAIMGAPIFGFCGMLAVTWLLIWIPIQEALNYNEENKRAIKEAIENNKAQEERKIINQQLQKENAKKKAESDKKLNYLSSEYNKVSRLLNDYYSVNILANQYRNIQSVYYIYDYMSSSQETLKDTLMHEHMENGIQRILAKLDVIIRQNEQIILQNRIAEATNQKILNQNAQMLTSLKRSEKNIETATQYAELSANYSKANAYFSEANAYLSLANYLK